MRYLAPFRFLSTAALALSFGPAPVAHAIELTKVGGPVKIADATSYGYAYAPVIINTAGKWHSYFCSSGRGVDDWDHVRHAESSDLQNWGAQSDLLQSTVHERANCDPSVVRFDAGDGLQYYLAYSGNVLNVQTVNFIARSPSPTGPFLKLTRRGTWEAQPADAKVIVTPKVPTPEPTQVYGAGQPSMVVKDGKVNQFYTDVTQTPPGIWLTTSTNMKDWSPAQFTGLDGSYASVDVKYDDASGEYVVVAIVNAHQASAYIVTRTSKDGLHWTEPKTICDQACTPDWANNVGMSGDDQGHIFGDELLVGYGAPYALGPTDQWGKWNAWATRFKIETKGKIKGNIDRVGANPATVEGWACGLKMDESIDVHLYLGGPAGVGTMAGGVKADRDSEGAVGEACKAGGSKYRFSIPLNAEILAQHAGKKVYVHGISPVGGANDLIDGSGTLSLPGSSASSGPEPTGKPGSTKSGSSAGGVEGAPAYRFYNPKTGEHFYSSNAEEGTAAGFTAEGVGFKTLADGQPGTKKLYRCLKSDGFHFVSEDPICENAGKQEGSYGSVFSDPGEGRVALYRGFNPVLGLHLITTNAAEFEANGYSQEGVLGYVKP